MQNLLNQCVTFLGATTLLGLLLAVVGIYTQVHTPEIRDFLGLEESENKVLPDSAQAESGGRSVAHNHALKAAEGHPDVVDGSSSVFLRPQTFEPDDEAQDDEAVYLKSGEKGPWLRPDDS